MNHINVVGPINKLGYGTHASSMVKAFTDIGVDVSLLPVGDRQDLYEQELFDKCIAQPFKEDSVTLHIYHDEYLKTYPGKHTIAFTVFETDVIRREAIENINTFAKIVFTTTKRHKEILEAHGIKQPIHVVNEGVDPKLYNTDPIEPLIETGKFTYLLLGKNEKRKNTDLVMTAFLEKMQYENVAIILNTFNYGHPAERHHMNWYNQNPVLLGYKYEEETETYIKFSNSFSDIYYMKPVLEREQMKQLYLSANVGISVSSAEGWGLSQCEMMACGKPVIISNVIGHSEYLENLPEAFRDMIVNPVGYEVAYDGKYFLGDRGMWSKIDIDTVIEKMEKAYNNNVGTELSEELSSYIITNYNWKVIAEKVKQLILRG